MAPFFHSLVPETRAGPACAMVYKVWAEDDEVDALWRSCAPAAGGEDTAAFLECSFELEEYLLDLKSCGKADWRPPSCAWAEQRPLSMLVSLKRASVHF